MSRGNLRWEKKKGRPRMGAAFYGQFISALLTHASEAITAIHRTIALGFKGHAGLSTAGRTDGREVLPGTASGVLTGVTAGLAALGLVLEAALGVELLLAGGENELLATLLAN